MTLLYLFIGGGLLALIVLISYTVKKKAYAEFGLSLGVIAAILLLAVAAYQVQMASDHKHMYLILQRTADGIRAGNADQVVAAFDRYTERGGSFWDSRNQLYADLWKLGAPSTSIQPDDSANGSQPVRSESIQTPPAAGSRR